MKVCIVGATGYIGSMLCNYLQPTYIITKITRFNDILNNQSIIPTFDIIIYLAGVTSRKTVKNIEDNTIHIIKLANLMTLNQLLIYASTTTLYEGLINAKEDSQILTDNIDIYSKSMLHREQTIQKLTNIKTIGLRLGIVVGLSPTQRAEIIHIEMLKSALFTNRIHVSNPFSNRPVISMQETLLAIETIINNTTNIPTNMHEIYNISSFNTTVAQIAIEISNETNAAIIYHNNTNSSTTNKGFSIDTTKFETTYNIKFTSTNESIIKILNTQTNIQLLTKNWQTNASGSCLICNSNNLIEMINLNDQPLANQFLPQPYTSIARYPLAMNRCLNCYHSQLSHIIPPEELFTNYIYLSGTTLTNADHFEKLSQEISALFTLPGKILDIACNDGSQLDKFKAKGWETYGVDPAANLASISKEKKHNITVGFWGDKTITETLPMFDVIIAQNVLAHVPNPVTFIVECTKKMHKDSILYIQTSQANIFINGEYDTIYHEHISFFTIKSFLYLASLTGLHIISANKLPIHGTSYLIGLRLKKAEDEGKIEEQISQLIDDEADIYLPTNPIKYKTQTNEKRKIITEMLNKSSEKGYKLVGFGASAKGNTLLNSLDPTTKFPTYIVDENSMKQNTYTPGTNISVVPYSTLQEDSKNPIAILVLAWNFLEEVKSKILMARTSNTLLIIPFPNPTIALLDNNEWKIMSSFPLCCMANEIFLGKLLISHFYNESLLLPYWILHHAPLFPYAVLIDYDSTDNSVEIINKLAPKTWKVILSRNKQFNAHEVDNEVRDIERSYPDTTWKLALTTTEFLIWPTMNQTLSNPQICSYGLSIKSMTGNDNIPLNPEIPLIEQRNMFYTAEYGYRYIHSKTNDAGRLYGVGRHTISIPSTHMEMGLIFKYIFTPWPEIIPRKLQIAQKQPASDIRNGLGYQHQYKQQKLEDLKADSILRCFPDFFITTKNNSTDILHSMLVHNQLQLPWCNIIVK